MESMSHMTKCLKSARIDQSEEALSVELNNQLWELMLAASAFLVRHCDESVSNIKYLQKSRPVQLRSSLTVTRSTDSCH